MREAVLITGGTGMVGRGLAARLLQHTDADLYLLIHRSGSDLSGPDVVREILSLPPSADYSARLMLLHGDISRPDLGLDGEEYQRLMGSVTHILHAAASTRFDLPLDQARRINVHGSENVARLALQCGGLRRFGFLSTVYVCGKQTGNIQEQPPSGEGRFVNTYEQSKAEAEMALWRIARNVPLEVYRLSTVLGDSRDGSVSHFTAPHQGLRIMHLGLGAMVPGRPEYAVDLISSDYTAATVMELFWACPPAERTYHITHGSGSLTLQEFIQESYRNLARVDPEWAGRNYPLPAIVTPDAFDLFMETARSAQNPAVVGTLKAIDLFARELAYPKQFVRTNLLDAFPAYSDQLPDIREYFPKVIEYCVRSKWGKVQ